MKMAVFISNKRISNAIILSLFLILTISAPAQASLALINNCKAVILALLNPVPNHKNINLTPEILAELKNAQQKVLENLIPMTHNTNGMRIPKTYEINGKTYNVQGYVGSGGEAHVYLVERGGQKYVYKVFGARKDLKRNIQLAHALRLRGLNILEPVEVDRKDTSALYSYVNGITMYHFVWEQTIYAKYGESPYTKYISAETKTFVRDRFLEFIQSVKKEAQQFGTKTALIPENVILDLDNFQFVIVDPR